MATPKWGFRQSSIMRRRVITLPLLPPFTERGSFMSHGGGGGEDM